MICEPGLLLSKVSNFQPFDGYTDKKASEKKLVRNAFREGDVWFNTGDLMRSQGFGHASFTDRLGGFHCQVDGDGRSPVPHIFACGDVTGFGGIDDAISAGARCGRAVVKSFGGNGLGGTS